MGNRTTMDMVDPPQPLWIEEPVGTPRMPDPVRDAAVRAVIAVSITLIAATIALLGALARAWMAAPSALAAVVCTVAATWAVLDVWVTRQAWNQRHGVVSDPSSVARRLRRERRRDRRAQRSAARRARRAGSPAPQRRLIFRA